MSVCSIWSRQPSTGPRPGWSNAVFSRRFSGTRARDEPVPKALQRPKATATTRFPTRCCQQDGNDGPTRGGCDRGDPDSYATHDRWSTWPQSDSGGAERRRDCHPQVSHIIASCADRYRQRRKAPVRRGFRGLSRLPKQYKEKARSLIVGGPLRNRPDVCQARSAHLLHQNGLAECHGLRDWPERRPVPFGALLWFEVDDGPPAPGLGAARRLLLISAGW